MSIKISAASRGRRTVAGVVAVAGCLLLTPACSALGGSEEPANQTSQTNAAPVLSTTGPTPSEPSTSTDPGSADPTGQTGEDLGAPVASRIASLVSGNDSGPAKLEIFQPRRSGNLVYLHVRLTPVRGRLYLSSIHLTDNDSGSGDRGLGRDGFQLIDTKNKKAYLVAHDGNGKCFCSRMASEFFVSPLLFSATFGAPPADVTTVDVSVAGFGVFRDVQIG